MISPQKQQCTGRRAEVAMSLDLTRRQPQGKPTEMFWASGYFQAAALPPREAGEGVINQRDTHIPTHTLVYAFYAACIS